MFKKKNILMDKYTKIVFVPSLPSICVIRQNYIRDAEMERK